MDRPAVAFDWLSRTSGRRSLLRRDACLANLNGAIWAIGNGLVSTTLITYLALDLGARGMAISLLLAAPRLAGVLRLATPSLFALSGSRKGLCIGAFAASSVALLLLLLFGLPGQLPTLQQTLVVLVVAWCVHHLLEYIGAVSLWSWLGDLYPLRIRGRLIGYRERWLTLGRVVGSGFSLLIVPYFQLLYEPAPGVTAPRWLSYSVSAGCGVAFLLLAVVPLLAMSSCEWKPSARPQAPLEALKRFLVDRPYRRLLVFSCALAIANGVTATPQGIYPYRVLGIEYTHMVLLRGMMRSGQSWLAGLAGRWIDRRGAKRMMFVSQMVAATGPLFFWFATPDARWWIVLAFVVWIAYAGLNVGLDHLKLALAPQDNNAPSLAAYHAISDLANAVSILMGGYLYDRLQGDLTRVLPIYAALFLAGWVARSLAGLLLLRLIEPKPKSQA